MLSIAPPPTIYLHTGSTDMRKSFDGLSGLIRGTFGADPSDGSLFLFVNRRRDRIKALEREVKELRKANEILKLASAFFAQAELDRRLK